MIIERFDGRAPIELWGTVVDKEDGGFGGPAALIFSCDPERRHDEIELIVRGLHGLSPRRAEPARAIALGHSIEDAATKMQVQPDAAREYSKNVFKKVGVTRQPELVNRIRSGVPGISPPNGSLFGSRGEAQRISD